MKDLIIKISYIFCILNILIYIGIICINPNNYDNLYDKHLTAYIRMYAMYYYLIYYPISYLLDSDRSVN